MLASTSLSPVAHTSAGLWTSSKSDKRTPVHFMVSGNRWSLQAFSRSYECHQRHQRPMAVGWQPCLSNATVKRCEQDLVSSRHTVLGGEEWEAVSGSELSPCHLSSSHKDDVHCPWQDSMAPHCTVFQISRPYPLVSDPKPGGTRGSVFLHDVLLPVVFLRMPGGQ